MATVDIGTHDIDALTKAHTRLQRPAERWTKVIEAGLDVVQEYAPRELNPAMKFLKEWNDEKRIEAAAWRWLRPQLEPDLHDKLPDLQRKVQLEHVPHNDFCGRLMAKCEEIREREPALRTHVCARIAEAEYRIHRPEHLSGLGDSFGLGMMQLMSAAERYRDDPVSNRLAAQKMVRTALAHACRQVSSLLAPDQERSSVMNANVMLPLACSNGGGDLSLGALASFEAQRGAQTMWDGFHKWSPHQALVVVIETEQGPGFEGFWIPDIRYKGQTLPGATRAFVTGEVQRLVTTDLPPFPIPDDDMEQRWRSYMKGTKPGTFTDELCLSIPIRSRTAHDCVDQPVAIINVNVRSNGLWPRVLSRSWRRLVAARMEAWGALLWAALGVVLAVDHCVNASRDSVLPLPLRLPDIGDLVANRSELAMLGSGSAVSGLLPPISGEDGHGR